MKKDIYTYLGVDAFQDYVLPTNPSTKNPLFKKIRDKHPELATDYNIKNSSKEAINKRLAQAYNYGGIHLVAAILYMMYRLYPDHQLYIIDIISNLLVNIYPLMVQMKIRARLLKILNRKEGQTQKEKTVDEDKMIQDPEKDIIILKNYIKTLEVK